MTGQDEVRVRPPGRFMTCNSNYEHYIHNCLWLKSEDGHVLRLLSLTLPLLTSHLTSDAASLHTYENEQWNTTIIQWWNATSKATHAALHMLFWYFVLPPIPFTGKHCPLVHYSTFMWLLSLHFSGQHLQHKKNLHNEIWHIVTDQTTQHRITSITSTVVKLEYNV